MHVEAHRIDGVVRDFYDINDVSFSGSEPEDMDSDYPRVLVLNGDVFESFIVELEYHESDNQDYLDGLDYLD